MKTLITGGAGFVGSHMAKLFKRAGHEVTVFDNLKRRGSELNLPEFKAQGIQFAHGDVRVLDDLMQLGNFDLMIEASAEPSVLAGLDGSPDYLFQTNLCGAYNCLEFARKKSGFMIFLSTSRVYSLDALKGIRLRETDARFELDERQDLPGLTARGITEKFPVDTARSLYGTTKLAAELFIQEYIYSYNLKAVINRCGVIAGPGQFGKVDQGVFTLWVANHFFKKPLKYTGFGGTGKQVRDLLHPEDLFSLLNLQIENISRINGETFCVGGGRGSSTSMKEYTRLCEECMGVSLAIPSDPQTSPVDIPLYLTDYSKVEKALGWTPKHAAKSIVADIGGWIKQNAEKLKPIFT